MRSADAIAPPAWPQALVPWAMVAACAVVAAGLLGLRGAAAWTGLALTCIALGAPLVQGAAAPGSDPRLRTACRMLLSGALGMLIGLSFDHPSGLVPLLSLCRSGSPGWLDGAWSSLAQMPYACVAMIAACQCGEWMHVRRARCRRRDRLAAHVAMLAGMALAHAPAAQLGGGLPGPWPAAVFLIWMVAGMAAGLLLVSWTFREA